MAASFLSIRRVISRIANIGRLAGRFAIAKWKIAVVGASFSLTSWATFAYVDKTTAAFLCLLGLQAMAALLTARDGAQGRMIRGSRTRPIAALASAVLAVAITGWLWWQGNKSTAESMLFLRKQSSAQDSLLYTTREIRSSLDSTVTRLSVLGSQQDVAGVRLSQLGAALGAARAAQESLDVAMNLQVAALRRGRFPLVIKHVSWDVLHDATDCVELFYDACECYPHRTVPGFEPLRAAGRGESLVEFGHVDEQTYAGVISGSDKPVPAIPAWAENAVKIPSGSDLLRYLVGCWRDDVVREWGMGARLDTDSLGIARRDSLIAARTGDPDYRRRAARVRARSEMFESAYGYGLRRRYLAKQLAEARSLPVDSVGDRARLAEMQGELQSIDHRMQAMDELLANSAFAIEQDSELELAEQEKRIASALWCISASRSLSRTFAIFKDLPEVPSDFKWKNDGQVIEVLSSGDLTFMAEVPNLKLFDLFGRFQTARLSGSSALRAFLGDLELQRWPVDMELHIAAGKMYLECEGDVTVGRDTRRFVDVCDLRGAWVCLSPWDAPVTPRTILLRVEGGGAIQLSEEDFSVGPYEWQWAQIKSENLLQFPICGE